MLNIVLAGLISIILAAACERSESPEIATLPTDDWVEVEIESDLLPNYPGFTMKVPPGWRVDHRPTDKVYLGTIDGDEARLYFWYLVGTQGLPLSEYPESEYSVTYETVNGVRVRLTHPRRGDLSGRTEAEFRNVHGNQLQLGLVIRGDDLTEEHQRYLVTIARSVRSLNTDTKTAEPSTPLSGSITGFQGRTLSYQEVLDVLNASVRQLVLEDRHFLRESDGEVCIALNRYWWQLFREERIPDTLFNALLTELQSLPAEVYEASDSLDADSKCEWGFAQHVRVLRVDLIKLNEGKLFVRIGERIGYGGSSWEYIFEQVNGDWLMTSRRGLGVS